MQRHLDIHHLEIEIGLPARVGVHRDEVVRAAQAKTVAGILEKADIGALQLIAKALHDGVEASFVEIELRPAADQLEAKALQCVLR